MGRLVNGVVRVALIGIVAAWVAGIAGALLAKRRLVPIDEPDADDVVLVSIFGPLAFRSTAANFRGGTVEIWFGGGVIDLRSATVDPDGAHLRVRVMFGGAQLAVPASWQVTSSVIGMGGVADGRPRIERSPDAPHLTIHGIVMFGGFGITTDLSEEANRQLDEITVGPA